MKPKLPKPVKYWVSRARPTISNPTPLPWDIFERTIETGAIWQYVADDNAWHDAHKNWISKGVYEMTPHYFRIKPYPYSPSSATKDRCPRCKADITGRKIFVMLEPAPDKYRHPVTHLWQCPDCGHEWRRE